MTLSPILSIHAEEAAFLWLLRDLAVHEPHYNLKDLADLDERVEAHLDGLRIGGDSGWASAQQELAWEETGEIFLGGVLAFESGSGERIETVLELATSTPDLARGLVAALGWLPWQQAKSKAEALVGSDDPLRKAMGIRVFGVHRENPGFGLVTQWASEQHPAVRLAAVRTAGELGRVDLRDSCRRVAGEADLALRFWGAWSGLLLGDAEATRTLYAVAQEDEARAARAADLLARVMPPDRTLSWFTSLAAGPETRRLACTVARALGEVSTVPWLLEIMENNKLARPAGEAISCMTGLDLAYEDLEGDWPEGFEAGPTESPEDEEVAMDPDEDLPWPEPVLLRAWWAENGWRFPAGVRHLAGVPVTAKAAREVLHSGRQRDRNAAALELVLMNPGTPLFETRAPGSRQKRALGL